MGLSLHGCFPVKPGHSLVVKLGFFLCVIKMGSLHRALVPVFTHPRLIRLLPDQVTHFPLALVKGRYNQPTLLSNSAFFFLLTLSLNSNQCLN